MTRYAVICEDGAIITFYARDIEGAGTVGPVLARALGKKAAR
jgi:hypothetical protein